MEVKERPFFPTPEIRNTFVSRIPTARPALLATLCAEAEVAKEMLKVACYTPPDVFFDFLGTFEPDIRVSILEQHIPGLGGQIAQIALLGPDRVKSIKDRAVESLGRENVLTLASLLINPNSQLPDISERVVRARAGIRLAGILGITPLAQVMPAYGEFARIPDFADKKLEMLANGTRALVSALKGNLRNKDLTLAQKIIEGLNGFAVEIPEGSMGWGYQSYINQDMDFIRRKVGPETDLAKSSDRLMVTLNREWSEEDTRYVERQVPKDPREKYAYFQSDIAYLLEPDRRPLARAVVDRLVELEQEFAPEGVFPTASIIGNHLSLIDGLLIDLESKILRHEVDLGRGFDERFCLLKEAVSLAILRLGMEMKTIGRMIPSEKHMAHCIRNVRKLDEEGSPHIDWKVGILDERYDAKGQYMEQIRRNEVAYGALKMQRGGSIYDEP